MPTNKIGESAVKYNVLYILKTQGPLRSSELKRKVIQVLSDQNLLSAEDTKALLNRNDSAINQVLGNIVSHRHDSKENFIKSGLIDYEPSGRDGILSITEMGENVLQNYIANSIKNQ